jgi:hypothetical protein
VPHDTRDQIVDFVRRWSEKTEIGAGRFNGWLDVTASKFYRRVTFMMLNADIVAVSPSSVRRVLGQAGLLSKWNGKPSKKGTGFE